jgi:dehydrogenase/reductase SDR family protein 7B
MDFNNKVVLITGASSGIGEGLAKAFNAAGAKVILSSRNVKELERVQQSFTKPEISSLVLPMDIQKYLELQTLAEKALLAFGKIDILINNAGISQRELAIDTPFEEDLRIIEIDLLGTIALTKALLPHFVKNGDSQIVVISSVMGKINTKYRTAYAAAKHGLVGYFESLRLELDGTVNVCNIMPGFIATNIVKNAVSQSYNPNNQNASGIKPDEFAKKALKAIYARKNNVYIGGIKEQFAMLLKRISPTIFDIFIKKMKVV